MRKSDEPSTIFLQRPPKSWILKLLEAVAEFSDDVGSRRHGIAVLMPALQSYSVAQPQAGRIIGQSLAGSTRCGASSSFLFDTKSIILTISMSGLLPPVCSRPSLSSGFTVYSLAIYRISPGRRRLRLGRPTVCHHCRGILFLFIRPQAPLRPK